jgi:Uma2 family endonuclease
MRLRLVDENGADVTEPYEVRLPGWTEDGYLAHAPEEGFYEFKDGALIVHAPVSIEHQEIVGFFTFLLRGVVSRRSLGKVFNGPAVLRLRENLLREPDILFVAAERLGIVRKGYVDGAADFVLEVISESGRQRDLEEKAGEYEAAGVAEYWIVDPVGREVLVHRLENQGFQVASVGDGIVESSRIAGFWIEVGWLWQRPMPNELDCLQKLLG